MSTPKISFNNKEDIINLNSDSRYVLTAANINEIKDVVNTLIDVVDNRTEIVDIFRYFRFIVPQNLESSLFNDIFYTIKFELSNWSDFTSNLVTFECISDINDYASKSLNDGYIFESFPTSEDETIFKVFRNGKWESNIKDIIFSSKDSGTEFQIDLYDKIKRFGRNVSNFPFFGRYKIIKLPKTSAETPIESEWIGFSVSFSNFNNELEFPKEYKEVWIEGQKTIIGNDEAHYIVKGKRIDGGIEVVDNLTNECQFKILNEKSSSLNGSTILANNLIEPDFQVLVAEFVDDNGTVYSASYSISIIPLKIVDYYIEGPDVINEATSEEYVIYGRLNTGDVINLTSESEITITSKGCALNISNGKAIISCLNEVYDNEVCPIIAKCNSVNYNFTSVATKTIFIKKNFYTTFKIEYKTTDPSYNLTKPEQNAAIDKMGNVGYIENSYHNDLYIQPKLIGPTSAENNVPIKYDPAKIVMHEIGSSNLKFDKVIFDSSGKPVSVKDNVSAHPASEVYIHINVDNLYNVNDDKDILVEIEYFNEITRTHVSKLYFIKLYINPKTKIVKIYIKLGKISLKKDDYTTYQVFGVALSNDEVDVTDEAELSIIVPEGFANAEVDYNDHLIKIGTIRPEIIATGGFIKANYNSLYAYQEITLENFNSGSDV